MAMNKRPVVSICCITYNHVKYIRQALDGFLMQKTDFDFEIIINDDASTDGTTEIIQEYVEKYAEVIIPVYHVENEYSKGIRGITVRNTFPLARGKYIALCEGDDYWTDHHKLQKQVDFLEANFEYVISYHQSQMLDENNNLGDIFPTDQGDLKVEDIFLCKTIPTASIMFRNIIDSIPAISNKISSGDTFIFCLLAQRSGKGAFMDNSISPSIYRQHQGGVWSSKSIKERYKISINSMFRLYDFFPEYRKYIKMRIYAMCQETKVLLNRRNYNSFMNYIFLKLFFKMEFGLLYLVLRKQLKQKK